MSKSLKFLIGAAAFSTAVPLMAQQPNLVRVDVSDVKADIAKSINVDVDKVPASVQAPASLAATVCKVPAGSLGPDKAACKATSTNAELNQIVQQEATKK